MSKPRDNRHKDLFRPSLEEIIDLGHPLARLSREIDWDFLDERFASVCAAGSGQPPLASRLVAGLLILKHMHDLSDEALCARWIENPYYQYFCGEESFCHALAFDRSSLTRWRQRLGEEHLSALLQESLSVAHKSGALATKDLERVVVDTTVQPKNLTFPTDAKLTHKAIVMLGRLARKHDVPLRQSYVRVAKRAAIMSGRYAHAKQFKRHNRELKFLRTRLGRMIRDIRRKTEGDEELKEVFAIPLSRASQLRRQKQRQRGPKLYSWHAPEVECIGKGKARAPYEFGCKVSIATPVTKPKGGQFVLHAQALHGNPYDGHTLGPVIAEHAQALHGNPYDGHTLGPVIAEMEKLTGVEVRRIHLDKGYRGHSYPNKFRVWISGQVRRVTKSIRREMKRRAAVEPVIGHVKAEHRMDRNYLKGRDGDRANAVLAAAGYNFSLLIRWFEALLRALIAAIHRAPIATQIA
jgi:IS5 family transposase